MLAAMSGRLNLFFPLWIDGGLSRDLLAGARALRDYLAPRVRFVEAPCDERCDPLIERDIAGYAAIRSHLERASASLDRIAPASLFTVGGGCGIEVPIVSHLRRRYAGLRVLWLDAHGDLNSPASSLSKHFHGMPLRFLLEAALDEAIGPRAATLDPSDLTLIGCRDLDPPEARYIGERGIRLIEARDAGTADPVPDGPPVYVHLDLDVLDPAEYPNVKCPAPGGISIAEAAALIERVMARSSVVGMSILENLAVERATLARLEPLFALAEGI
jgi:arginase